MPLFKSNSALIAFDNSYRNEELSNSFSFLNFIQDLNFNINVERINQKSIGKSDLNRVIFTQPQVNIEISYFHKINLFNESLFGFHINQSTYESKTFLDKFKDNFKNNGAIILLNEAQGDDLFYKIKQNGYTDDIIAISIGQIYLNNYSFSYSVGSLPIAKASFSANELKASNLNNQSFNDWDGVTRNLNAQMISDYEGYTNFGVKKNIVLQMNDFYYSTSGLNNLNFPSVDFSSLTNGTIRGIQFSIDFQRNKFFFFENGLSSNDRYFLLPALGKLTINGIMQNINKKTLDSIVSSDNKFSMTIALGLDADDLNKTTFYFSNLKIDSFDYSINLNNLIEYTMDMSFEVSSESGLIINSYFASPKEEEDFGQFITIKSSDGSTIFAQDGQNQLQIVAIR
jgi:hypothetical protein